MRRVCWIPDPSAVYRLAEITHGYGTSEYTVKGLDLHGKPLVPAQILKIEASQTYPVESLEELAHPPSDLIQLGDVHRPGILHTLRERFLKDSVYTSVGPILIALNPFRWIEGVYEDEVKLKYFHGQYNLSENPHVFAMAHDALMGLQYGKNQSLIISGESGAGKTEATKQCLNYLAVVAGSSTGVHNRILLANPILESWGNAKTLRNNNSSRFGKFIEILMSKGGEIAGSSNTTYLLEKSRVVFQESGERSYHVFYQLLFGAPDSLIHDYRLQEMKNDPKSVFYLSQSGCWQIEGVDDAANYVEVVEAQNIVGFPEEVCLILLRMIAGVLHLGNISFFSNPSNSEETIINSQSDFSFSATSYLFGIDPVTFTRALLFKSVRSGKRKSITYAPYLPLTAIENRDALAKEIYNRCFDYIVATINTNINIAPEKLAALDTCMIGVLDIFGFEIFKKNSFEQLCINLANEALQRHFNVHIFQTEMEIYLSEDIVIPNLSYNDNQDVLDLIIKKPKGLIPLLDEEGQVPRGSWEGFLSKFTKQHLGVSKRLKAKPGSKVFTLVHYAGEVVYDPSLFIVKNKDTLSTDLLEVLSLSSIPFVTELFRDILDDQTIPAGRASQVPTKQTVGTKFRVQLDSLIASLNATSPKYIRCIKPNSAKRPAIFEPDMTNEQLTYSGVFEAVVIMQNGYPFRLSHLEFRSRYHMLAINSDKRKRIFGSICGRDELLALGEILTELHTSLQSCHIGKTMVFYRVEQHRILESHRKNILEHALHILQRSLRRFVARNLYISIKAATMNCNSSILLGDVTSMRVYSSELSSLRESFLKIYNILLLEPECLEIAHNYSAALEVKQQCEKEILSLLDESLNIFIVFPDLMRVVDAFQSIEYSTCLNGHIIEVNWKQVEVFIIAYQRVQKYRKIIDIKQHLDKGILDQNEVLLKYWLEKLDECRSSGEVDHEFCREEEKSAKKAVKAAEELFEIFFSKALSAISNGKLLQKTIMNNLTSFDELIAINVDVDPGPLHAFLCKISEERKAKHSSSIQIEWLTRICKELLHLRELALKMHWKTIWDMLPRWSNYLTIPTTKNPPNHGIENDLLPCIAEVEETLRAEIKTFYTCAISEVKFRKLGDELALNPIPSKLTLVQPDAELSSLMNLISFLNQPDEKANMSSNQLTALQYATSKGKIRQSIFAQDLNSLKALLTEESLSLPSNDEDYILACKWLKFYDALNKIKTALQDGPKGMPGSLELESVSGQSLSQVIQICNGFMVEPSKFWSQMILILQFLYEVRSSWVWNDLSKTLHFLNSDANPFRNQLDDSHLKESPPFFTEVVMTARDEIELSQKEIVHLIALDELLSNIRDGAVKGEVGALDTTSVEVDILRATLSSCRTRLIPTPSILQLIQDCEVLITLRTCVLTQEWEYLLRVTEELAIETHDFSDTNSYLKPEFETIFGEAQDLQARKCMESALKEEVLFLNEENEMLYSDESDMTSNLYSAIEFCNSQQQLSFEAKFLLSNAVLILALRESILCPAWEEVPLALRSLETDDLAQKLFDLSQNWTYDECISNLTSLLAPSKRENIVIGHEEVIPVSKLLSHALTLEVHTLVEHELAIIRRAYLERRCRSVLILAACVGQIRGSVATLDNSQIAVEPLSEAIAFVYIHSGQLSGLANLWLEIAIHLLQFRFALGKIVAMNNSLDLSNYVDQEQLNRCSALVKRSHRGKYLENNELDLRGFPTQELSLVVDHIFDCISINELATALHSGRPQFYNGKFDTKNVRFDHVIRALEVAKKCENISDHLDRLMFYAELCVNLRKAILNHKWDLTESGERAAPTLEQTRGFSVKQCLLEYQQANRFFQNPIEGIPPKTLREEFQITQREWERRLILQGFPIAFQSGKVGGRNGNLFLHEIKYQRLADQIERTRSWSEQTGVKDPDLDLLVKAGQELVQVRRRALEVHQKYKREATFRRSTNMISEILDSEFISDAILNALEKVDGLLVYPYPMNTEWKHIDQAVSKMEISGRIESTRLQVELLGTETFERSFNGNIVRTLHSLDEFTTSPPYPDDAKIILNELQNSCHSYRARTIELDSKGIIKPSEISEFLFVSSVIVIHLLSAELENRFDPFHRDWLFELPNNLSPPISSLSSHLMSPTHTVQDILRTASTLHNLHPSARIQVFRLSQHVEAEVTFLELTNALSNGAVSGSVGHISFESISSNFLSRALDRAIMFVATPSHSSQIEKGVIFPKSRQWLVRSKAFLGNRSDIFIYSTSGNSARFRYSSEYNANQVAMIETLSGFQEPVVYDGIGRVKYNQVSSELLSLAIKQAETKNSYRSEITRLRHTCELICELRVAIKLRNYQAAFDILNGNIGHDGQSFKDLLSSIYAANFAIHAGAIEEFSLIALETCESYWRFAAKAALIRGVVRGSRCCFHLSEVNCDSIDEVIEMIEGLVEISRESIVIRELCFMVKHLRKCTINAIISPGTEELLYKRRKEPIPSLSSNKLSAILKLGFIDDAIRNGILVVNALSPQPYNVVIQTNYAKFVTIANVVEHVKESIKVIPEDNLVITHRNILLDECKLISEFCLFYTVMLTLEKVLNIEALWYSYSTSRLEMDPNLISLVVKAITDAEYLNINRLSPAENLWSPLLDLALAYRDILKVVSSNDCTLGTTNFADLLLDRLNSFISFVKLLPPLSYIISKHYETIQACILDHEHYVLLEQYITFSQNFSIKLSSLGANDPYLVPLSQAEYSGTPLNEILVVTQNIKPLSLLTHRLKELTLLHIQMRQSVLAHEWHHALMAARTILLEVTIKIHLVEAEMVVQYLTLHHACRSLEQGLLSCIFPPVVGWSNYSTAMSLALSITDFPLRSSIEKSCGLQAAFSCTVGGGRSPLLIELLALGVAVVSLVCAVRRRTWSSQSSEHAAPIFLARETFIHLFPINRSFEDINSQLETSFDELFQTQEIDISVAVAIERLRECVRKTTIVPEYITEYITFMVSSAEMEQRIFDFSKSIRDVFSEERITGIPGQLHCSPQSIENISQLIRKLETDMSTIDKSLGLRQSYQCLKIALMYRTAILKQDWISLGSLIQLFQYMAKIDLGEIESRCAEFMHIPILEDNLLLNQKEEYFRIVSANTLYTLKNFANSANAHLTIKPTELDPQIPTISKTILGLEDPQLILPSTPEMQVEISLLEKHYYFEKSCQLFADALLHTPATGIPGELNTSNIQYSKFYKVHELLREIGLLSFSSGSQLFDACSAMIALRVGQRSGKLVDIKQALAQCKSILSEEGKVINATDLTGETKCIRQRYLDDAVKEIELASLDCVQQECIQDLYSALITNRLPLSSAAIGEAALSFTSVDEDLTIDLSHAIRESQRKGITCRRGQTLMATCRLIVGIRKTVLNRDWVELKAIFSDFDNQEKDKYDQIALEEVESARRLMVISSAVEMASEAIDSNRIKGSIGDIDLLSVNVGALERAKEEFEFVKVEWMTPPVNCFYVSCSTLIHIRNFSINYQWASVFDIATIALEKQAQINQLVSNAQLEIQLAHDHAAFVICRRSLLDAISNGRMDGDIGEVSTYDISASVAEEALRLSLKLNIEHPEIQKLEASSRIIYDLRCAQQRGHWMADPLTRNSSARGSEEASQSLPDAECMIVAESLVSLSNFDLKVTTGASMKSLLLSSYLGRRVQCDPSCLSEAFHIQPTQFGNIGWLLKNNGLDFDVEGVHITEDGTHRHSVEEILEGAAYVERAIGIVEEAMPEIAFAQEELNYRHTIHMLLRAMSSAGFKGVPGKLDATDVDLYPLERAILFAESSPDISERGTCRSLLRDARILYQVRKSRTAKDWGELNRAILDAITLSTICPPLPLEINTFGEEAQPDPMLPFVWNEISLIRADMYFYVCLSEFAQEMTNRVNKEAFRDIMFTRKEETSALTALLKTMLKTKAVAELYPSSEFDRLLEAQHAALELRTHMTFDSTSSPRIIISNVINCRERDKKDGVTSYISLLMPDISQLSNVLDTEQLVESLEKSIVRDQGYLRCPIGHINADEIDLDFIRISITSAMPFLNATGSRDHLNLLSLATAVLAIRTEVVSKNWSRVKELIDAHESLLNIHPTLVSEEISRLIIEAENDEVCQKMRIALETGRLTNVLALVKKISRHRSASMTTITPLPRSNSSELPPSFSRVITQDVEEGSSVTLDESIENALAVKNRSDITTGLLRASVLIRALRSAISTGDWEEVQQIVSEESNYTRMPTFSIEEIRAAKAALHYRNCMSSLAKGLVNGAASGVPGKINVSAVDFTTLQTAISQAEVLDIADPATSIVLEIAYRICALRQAVVASHWFSIPPCVDDFFGEGAESETHTYAIERIEDRVARLRAASETEIQVFTAVPFTEHQPNLNLSRNDDVDSVESLLAEFKNRLFILSDLKAILNLRSTSEGNTESIDFDSIQSDSADFNDLSDVPSSHDWVEHQLEAIRSVLQEIKLLDTDLRERKRQELVVSALEKIPIPVSQFKNKPEDRPEIVAEKDDQEDVFYIRHLERSIRAAQSIKGEVPKETSKIIRTAELILKFRKIMNSLEIESFKHLLDEANMLSNRNLLSMHYGVYELNAYRSATLTVTLAKGELIKALKSGRIRGSLSQIRTEEIEVESLEFWVSSCTSLMETTKELSMGLFDALQEAKILLELRKLVKRNHWDGVNDILLRHSDLFYRFEFGTDEIRHIQFASKFRTVSSTIYDLVSDDLPIGKEEQCAYVLLKLDALERALHSAEAVMKYQTDLLNQHVDQMKSAPLNGTTQSLLSGTIEEDETEPSDDEFETPKLNDTANMTEFQMLCLGAARVIQLWNAIKNKNWLEEQIAAGQVHSLPRPKDPFFYFFLESLRQHEVSQRMGAIHDELKVLKIDADSKIRNIRQSIRTSFATRNRTRTFATPPKVAVSKLQTPPKTRRSSLSVDGSPAPLSSYSSNHHQSVPTPSPQSNPSRRRSLGSISEERMISPMPVRNTRETESIPFILSSSDWTALPSFAVKQFIQARNILIDRVTKLRLVWGCREGSAEEGYSGNISLANVNIDLLSVALSDVRRVEFYTIQMSSKFIFSKEVLGYIRVAKILLSLRKAVIGDNVDLLVQELRQLNYLNGSRNFDLSTSQFPAFEKELLLFERFAYECVAEKTVRSAVKFLCAIDLMSASLTLHPSMLNLKTLDKTVKPVGVVTQNYRHCVNVATLLYQAVISSVMCNQSRVRKCESDIISHVQQPDSPLNDLVKEIQLALRTLHSSATVRAISDNVSESPSHPYDVQVDFISSIHLARRRSILGGTRSRRPSVIHEMKQGYGLGGQTNECNIEPVGDHPLASPFMTSSSSDLAAMISLLIQIHSDANENSSLLVPTFPSKLLEIPTVLICTLEKYYPKQSFSIEHFLPQATIPNFDIFWILVGQLLLLSVQTTMRAYNLLTPSERVLPLETSLLHPCVLELLATLKSQPSQKINLASMSNFFTQICFFLQSLDRQIHQKTDLISKRLNDTRVAWKREASFAQTIDIVYQIVVSFREQVISWTRDMKDVLQMTDMEWLLSDHERITKRCISQSNSLIRILSTCSIMESSAEREKIQQGLREAVHKRKRQFV